MSSCWHHRLMAVAGVILATGFVPSFSHAAPQEPRVSSTKASSAQTGQSRAIKKQVSSRRVSASSRKAFAASESGYDSLGSRLGLRSELTEIALNSSAVIVVNQASGQVLLEKNPDIALPIASITKLMTAVVTMEANLPLSDVIEIEKSDTQLEKYTGSRLRVGTSFTRAELLNLALMSSENRAAHALGRSYPGGMEAFVLAMNKKADSLGMSNSHFVEPTGLSSSNVSTPRDLSRLVKEATRFPLIRQYSTAREAIVQVGGRYQQFRNTNALARNGDWELGISKTGFIRDAGKCLVMQANIDNTDVIIVMLDAQGSQKRITDAERIRRWLSADKDRQALAVRS